jgi:hypothetical protein
VPVLPLGFLGWSLTILVNLCPTIGVILTPTLTHRIVLHLTTATVKLRLLIVVVVLVVVVVVMVVAVVAAHIMALHLIHNTILVLTLTILLLAVTDI